MTTPSGLPIKALQWWGVASGAVADRSSTQVVWEKINAAATSQGLGSPGLSLADFNALRSAAVQVRNSSEALARGNPETALDATMVGVAPWARKQTLRNDLGKWQVRFNHTTQDENGDQADNWRTVVFTGSLPTTPGELFDQLDQDAEAMADKYNSSHVGYSSVTVMAF